MKRTNRSRGSKPNWVKGIALESIVSLMGQASENAEKKPELAKRYVELARKISSRYNVTIPAEWKRKFCKECFVFWEPGVTLKVRVRNRKVVYRCTACGGESGIGYGKRAGKKTG